MLFRLRQYLFDAYESRHTSSFRQKISSDTPIQIDDQDDSDKIHEFCNIFCTITKNNSFRIELIGSFPITSEMKDLAEIYNGSADTTQGRLVLELNTNKINVLIDLADKIRKTSLIGIEVNPAWLAISARTISSLYRFVRIIKEFKNVHHNTLPGRLAVLQHVLKSIAA